MINYDTPCFSLSVFGEVSDEYKKYYDAAYIDCIGFFSEPLWCTIGEWQRIFSGKMGAFDLRLIKDPITENTELPFVYYEKNENIDRLRFLEKLIKDGLYGLCISNKTVCLY